nr:palmitoleoyl-protein carboxylesterase NOTUM isoform X2 [Pelodiscus sinensis]|eukprot:XP_025038183.1 palmitoleoyl-protein carboxylesterase NOTUM isoform X2 [Pelodiscus sinensis]
MSGLELQRIKPGKACDREGPQPLPGSLSLSCGLTFSEFKVCKYPCKKASNGPTSSLQTASLPSGSSDTVGWGYVKEAYTSVLLMVNSLFSSAGGTGVLLNVDRVAEQLEEMGYQGIQVRGLADSGWFLDNKQYRRTDCIDTITCAPTEAIRRGIRYWNGVVPERCKLQFKEGEEWNCFFGYKIYPTLRCPVFVVQWLFDEAQLTVDNVHLTGQPVQEGQWLYIQNLGRELRNTLKDVTASFAPACLSHEIITRNHWTDIQVKGTSLPRALHCWDRSLHESNKNGKAPLKGCPIHLIDSCPWPHCNPSCPTIRDQFTGQEMNVIQFLMHMGFDVQKMAQQQGLEPSKLLGMLSSGS